MITMILKKVRQKHSVKSIFILIFIPPQGLFLLGGVFFQYFAFAEFYSFIVSPLKGTGPFK